MAFIVECVDTTQDEEIGLSLINQQMFGPFGTLEEAEDWLNDTAALQFEVCDIHELKSVENLFAEIRSRKPSSKTRIRISRA